MKVNRIIIDRHGQTFPKFPKYQVCNVFTISLKTSFRDEVAFCMQINTAFSTSLFKHLGCQSFVQADVISTDRHIQPFSKYSD